jgi:head-tail adaptor
VKRIGKLDRKITLVSKSITESATGRGAFGEIEESSANVSLSEVPLFAEVIEFAGTERTVNGKEVAVSKAKFRIRHRAVNPRDSITYNGRSFDILHIEPNQESRDDSLTILAEEVV